MPTPLIYLLKKKKKKKKTFRLIFCRKVKKKERMDSQNIPGEWYCSMFLNLASRKKKKKQAND